MARRSGKGNSQGAASVRALTGVRGLDAVLRGGLPPGQLYLIRGAPGVGKTTLALQFMLEGVRNGERGLYVLASESKAELEHVAASHGWTLAGVELFELIAEEQLMQASTPQTVFHPAEVELNELRQALLAEVERVRPARLVLDSLSELRVLATGGYGFRREILTLKRILEGRDCTVLMLDDLIAPPPEMQLDSIAHGVILLEQRAPEFGADRRRLRVVKVRGLVYAEGYHDFRIRTGGLEVYPRLVASVSRADHVLTRVGTGIAGLDALLHGGLDAGTSTLLMGPSGSGKSTVAMHCVDAAALRGERAAVYVFDENLPVLLGRCETLGIKLRSHVESGLVHLRKIDPSELTPGELSQRVCDDVDQRGVRLVVVDSLAGYVQAMPQERFLALLMHELLASLGQRQVTSIVVTGQHGLFGEYTSADFDVSYLADTVLLFRYFEHAGEVRRAVSVFKRRIGAHDRTIRELHFGPGGVEVGPPLRQFRGVLTGVPVYERGGVLGPQA